MDFTVSTDLDGPIAVLTAAGEIDVATAEPLRQALLDAEARGATRVVVDLTRVDFLDSTGLGVLVGSLKRLREGGGELYLAVTHPHLLKVMRVTNLDKVFPIVESADDALVEARAALGA